MSRCAYEGMKKRYDIVFYVPIEFPLERDAIRYEGVEFQKQIDDIIVDGLHHFGQPYITLSGSLEERMDTIKKTIALFFK